MSGGKWETGIESIGSLPNDWHLQRLSNVADLFGRIGWQGLTSDEYTDEGAYLVTSTDFADGCVNWDTCVHVSEERWEEAWQIKLSEGDLLISKDGTIGKLAIVKNLPGHASLNSGLMRIVPKSDAYETRFLFYVLQTDVFTDWYRSIDSGASTIKHLFQGDFVHFVFPLPPVEEQRWIVREIDSEVSRLDYAMALIEGQISTLEAYRRSVIQETITKGLDSAVPMKDSGIEWIGMIPNHWQLQRIGRIVDILAGYAFKSEDFVPDGKYRLLRGINVGVGTVRWDDTVYTNNELEVCDRYKLNEGDLLVGLDRPWIGSGTRIAFVTEDDSNSYLVQRVARLRSESTAELKLVSYALEGDLFYASLSASVTGVSVPHISPSQVAKVLVPWPNSEEELAGIVHSLDARDRKSVV